MNASFNAFSISNSLHIHIYVSNDWGFTYCIHSLGPLTSPCISSLKVFLRKFLLIFLLRKAVTLAKRAGEGGWRPCFSRLILKITFNKCSFLCVVYQFIFWIWQDLSWKSAKPLKKAFSVCLLSCLTADSGGLLLSQKPKLAKVTADKIGLSLVCLAFVKLQASKMRKNDMLNKICYHLPLSAVVHIKDDQ